MRIFQSNFVTLKTMYNKSNSLTVGLLATITVLLISACGGLAGEPNIVSTLPPRPTQAPTPVVSEDTAIAQADISAGAAIYAENCVRCHGAEGKGDGEFALSGQLPVPVPDFTNAQTASDKTPNFYFAAITNGNLAALMPPWGDKLSIDERWAVAMYVYTLHYGQERIAAGAEIWESTCSECHGVNGQADGPRSSELNVEADFSNHNQLADKSDMELLATLTQSENPAHKFDTLSENQLWDTVTFLRTLSLTEVGTIAQVAQQPEPVETETPSNTNTDTTPETTVTGEALVEISGSVTNATADGIVPDDLVITLHVLDSQFNDEPYEMPVGTDGSFSFTDIPMLADRGYIVTTMHEDRMFGSEFIQGDLNLTDMDLSFEIYDLTDDPSVIEIRSMILQISPDPNGLQVVQIINYQNTSDKLFSTDEVLGDSFFASVKLYLPEDAQLLDMADSTQRYVVSNDGKTITDSRAVMPNAEHLVHAIYGLPYDGERSVVHPVNYNIAGSVQVLLPQGLSLTGEQFTSLGAQTIGSSTFETYELNTPLSIGETLEYTLQGTVNIPVETVGDTASASSSIDLASALPIALVVLGIAVLIAAAVMYMRSTQSENQPVSIDSTQLLIDGLIQQIADLDKQHELGTIDTETYETQRQQFKSTLASLMKKSAEK